MLSGREIVWHVLQRRSILSQWKSRRKVSRGCIKYKWHILAQGFSFVKAQKRPQDIPKKTKNKTKKPPLNSDQRSDEKLHRSLTFAFSTTESVGLCLTWIVCLQTIKGCTHLIETLQTRWVWTLREKPQAEQVSSDLCFLCLALCWEFVRTRQRRLHLGLFCIRGPRGRRSVPNDKLWLRRAGGNPALTGVYSRICFALHRCALSGL